MSDEPRPEFSGPGLRHQARVAAADPERLPLTGVMMCRRPDEEGWKVARTENLSRPERMAMGVYRAARMRRCATRLASSFPRRRRQPRQHRPRARRSTSRSAGGGSRGDPDEPEPAEGRPPLPPRSLYAFGCLSAEARGAEVEAIQ
jgi:hypothetical protein